MPYLQQVRHVPYERRCKNSSFCNINIAKTGFLSLLMCNIRLFNTIIWPTWSPLDANVEIKSQTTDKTLHFFFKKSLTFAAAFPCEEIG